MAQLPALTPGAPEFEGGGPNRDLSSGVSWVVTFSALPDITLSGASVGSTNILSTNFGTACCQTQSVSTSTAIASNGEAYRVVQLVLEVVS